MPEYLTKEEIKQWRSSLEKITLEEFAKRLGKEIEEDKHTNDLVDIVMKGHSSTVTTSRIDTGSSIERLSSLSQKTMSREREIAPTSYAPKQEVKPVVKAEKVVEAAKEVIKKETAKAQASAKSQQPIIADNSGYEFKKPLTEREQMVFNYFLNNKDTVVFAKDLAQLLQIPRDYVYKYIKTLRAKIEGDNLRNAESGGFILSDK